MEQAQAKDILKEKLNQFIWKYYQNKLIKGVLYSIALWVSFFLILIGLEFFGYFSTTIRAVLFYADVAFTIVLVYAFIFVPLSKMFQFGRTISHIDAAKIIGRYFPEIKDKLVNVLQLREIKGEENDLLAASITQKTKELAPIAFIKAIDFSKNKKYFRRAMLPVGLFVCLLALIPSFIAEPAKRIFDYKTAYEKPAPFRFILLNEDLTTVQGSDYVIEVEVEGDEIPKMLHVKIDGKTYLMQQDRKRKFSCVLHHVQQTQKFRFAAGEIESKTFTLQVNKKPVLLDFHVKIKYPSYTGKPDETILNIGDLILPKGSVATWHFRTQDAQTLKFVEDSMAVEMEAKKGTVTHTKRIMKSGNYTIYSANQYVPKGDSLFFSVRVVEDMAPQISVLEQRDSSVIGDVFFRGQIKDDYGFSKLQFHFIHHHGDPTKEATRKTIEIPIIEKTTGQEFYYDYHLAGEDIQPGDQLTYYFEVCDNDAVNGHKCALSQSFSVKTLTEKAFDEVAEKANQSMKNETEKALEEIKKQQKEINEILKKIVEKKNWNWQDKKQIESLYNKQKSLQERIESLKEKIKQNNRSEQQYKQRNEDILEKQKQLEKLFEEVMNDDIKKMFEELQRLSENIEKEKLKEALDKIQMTNEDVEKQLDRNLELFKRLELEKKMSDAIQKTEKLAEEQKKRAEETKQADKSAEQRKNDQENLNQQFQDLRKDLKEIEEKNAALEQPNSFKRPEKQEQKIEGLQQSATQKLQKEKNKSAAQDQQSAAEELDKMSEELEDMQEQMEQENMGEDAEQTRRLLKNLITISKQQEELLKASQNTRIAHPNYQKIINQQNRIKDDMQMVGDSLQAIAKRQPIVEQTIQKELSAVKQQVNKSLEALLFYNQAIYEYVEYNRTAGVNQQYAMTSMNNLALLLAESLKKMEKQMKSKSNKQSGKKSNMSCPNSGSQQKKPSGKKPSAQTIREMQEQLSKQLEQLKKQLEQRGKDGKKTRIGENAQMNEELARAAAQQEAIRKMMQEYGEERKSKTGKSNGDLEQLQKEMDKNAEDIVNKLITPQTLQRQQNIITRLLEHEKAEMQREQEDRRESNTAKEIYAPEGNKEIEYNKLKTREMDLFRSEVPEFSPYYKQKVNEYFYIFGQ